MHSVIDAALKRISPRLVVETACTLFLGYLFTQYARQETTGQASDVRLISS